MTFDGKGISENIKISPIRDKQFPDEREEGTLKEVPLKYLRQIDILVDTRVFTRGSLESIALDIKKINPLIEVNIIKKWNLIK
jgi:3-methyladenine DNA glycosylase AlkC